VYVAKLHKRTTDEDMKREFSKFGRIKEIILKHTYAFVGYDDHEAAEAAVREMNGKTFMNGEEIVVE